MTPGAASAVGLWRSPLVAALARWKAPTDQDVDRLDSVTEWLRR
jgi:hypothetical protein